MVEITTARAAERFSACRGSAGEWVVVDQDRRDEALVRCNDANNAKLIAGLMNGDLSALASASPEALAHCRAAMGGLLRVLKPRGRPSIGADAFPQI